ncbi:hypothetical protein [Magpiepox virus 2]|nr:hypothetical protein [Magpiepox virus 2]
MIYTIFVYVIYIIINVIHLKEFLFYQFIYCFKYRRQGINIYKFSVYS